MAKVVVVRHRTAKKVKMMRVYRDAIIATLSTKRFFFVDVLFVIVQRIASRFVNELSSSIREAGVVVI
jgi:hypothetical protein